MQRHGPHALGAALLFGFVSFCELGASSCSGRSLASRSAAPSGSPGDADGGYGGAFPAVEPTATNVDNEDPGESSGPASVTPEAGDAADDGEVGAGAAIVDDAPDGACTSPLAAGDLTIDELMVESVAGAGDDGEWFEVASGLDCVANLNGLHGECPRGSKVSTFDVTSDTWIPAHGTFVVADSNDPAINHRLPGTLVVWLGHPGDVLRNQGSTITLTLSGAGGGDIIDTVTYPSLPADVGASLAFPSGCDPSLRADFTHWKRSTASWFPGFLGTPNAANTDVECP
jgi:hypothetical protein